MALPTRYGQWQITLPFSLNNDYFGIPAETQNFITPLTNAVPILSQFNVAGTNPSGSRHLKTHPSFIKILASGRGHASVAFGALDLNATDISTGSGVSNTKVFLFRISRITSPGISRVHNMKVWASDMSDFIVKNSSKVLFKTSKPWLQNFAFVPLDLGNKNLWLPESLPEAQNLRRTDGGVTIHGSGDADVSQWVYMALGASGTLPLGEYGRIINGHPSGFLIRITYNIDNIKPFWD